MKISVRAVRISVLLIWAIYCIIPIFWVFTTSFKPNIEAAKFPPTLFPQHPTLANYVYVLSSPELSRAILNSIFLSITASLLCITVSALAGYAFSRYKFQGKKFLMSLLLGSFLIPPVVNIIPLFVMFSRIFGTTNSLLELVLVDQLYILPLNIFLFKNYFDTIPPELEEAAQVDGCTRLQAFYKVVLPVSKPALAVGMVFAFRFVWNEFIFATTFISSPSKNVFAAAIYNFIGLYKVQFGYLAAAIIIMCIPPMIILGLFQRYIIAGLRMGGVKR